MLTDSRQCGFTLIELMVVLTIMTLLLLAVAPSFSSWVANAKVRSVAEEVANGLRMAQAEAIRRNRPAVFVVTNLAPGLSQTPAANGVNWYVQVLPLLGASSQAATDPDYVQGSNYAKQSGVTIASTSPVLCIGSVGSVVAISDTATNNVLGVACTAGAKTYTVSKSNADRALKVMVSVGGQVRMCDPSKTLDASNLDGCPAS